jgi:hypothetical protein
MPGRARSTGGAEDFSAGLRQRRGQIFTLASLKFAAGQHSGSIRRRGEHSGQSVRGLKPVELQKATLGKDDGALDGVLQFAHVARPFLGSELAHRGLRNPVTPVVTDRSRPWDLTLRQLFAGDLREYESLRRGSLGFFPRLGENGYTKLRRNRKLLQSRHPSHWTKCNKLH